MKEKLPIIAFVMLIVTIQTKANNIQLSNVLLNGQNTAGQYSIINFDVSWENSWRLITNQANYDGAWIFVKFRKISGSVWQHATLNTSGNTTPSGSTLQISADGKGAWIYHASVKTDFAGNVNYTGAKVQWNYGVDGVLNTDSVEIKVFALEMVYVPTGSYQLGSGGTETDHFFIAGTNNPYNVTSENTPNIVGTGTGNLNYSHTDGHGDGVGPIPAAFPKGYNAFWIMKYECSEQQYVDFLNNLDGARSNNRNPALDPYVSTNFFIIGTQPDLVAKYPERAMDFIDGNDYLAFADWAALRPFTELEYEKACRGTLNAVANEYPWGNTTATQTTTVLNQGLANETPGNGNANFNYGLSISTRTGMYATTDPRSSRTSTGGTYYGVLDMAGNVCEFCIWVGSPAGRAFTAANGDGALDINGNANVPTWPPDATGITIRGGSWQATSPGLQTSDRGAVYIGSIDYRDRNYGIRLARTAE